MSRRVRITPRAYEDLRGIARYTRKTWGDAQCASYLHALDKRFEWLADNPERGRARPDIADGYYCVRQGEHLIFYLIHDDSIDIIGIPHQVMDIEGYFDFQNS